jgi:hypothetical protein
MLWNDDKKAICPIQKWSLYMSSYFVVFEAIMMSSKMKSLSLCHGIDEYDP